MLQHSASALIDLRRQAIDLFNEGVRAAGPGAAVATALERRRALIDAAGRVILIAFGKAACAMTAAALPFVSGKLGAGLVVTNRESVVPLEGVEVIPAGHPLPDDGSLLAGDRIEKLAASVRRGDLLLVLISGGGSALVCAPVAGISLKDKIELNDAMLRSGAGIRQINAVRQQLSRLKGGGLARLAACADILSLVVSDVPGDDVSIVASGPTAPRLALALEASDVLRQHGIDARFPMPVDCADDDGAGYDHVENVVIGSNRISVDRVAESARGRNIRVVELPGWLRGDVGVVARRLHRIALEHSGHCGPVALVAGGETTVKVSGTGKGGRNQELALRFALENEQSPIRRPWVFLSGGTDGRDGPTDAAGAVVDAGSIGWLRMFGREPADVLRNNDSHSALACTGDLLVTGSTGTNVADLQILLMQ